ncbi:MAG: VWA domain-containing protein [Nanoarchaeota archaeon]|nr:VWA domain-containing protein [Nanoarchaeota archaeon]
MSTLRSSRRPKRVVIFDRRDIKSLDKEKPVEISNFSRAEEITGKLEFNAVDDKLMHSVLENDQEKLNEGKIIEDAINQGISAFTPDKMFEQMVKNFSIAKQIFGESLIQQLSGYDPEYIERNINVPEFRKELKKRIEERVEKLMADKLVSKDGIITEKGIELASLVLYMEELDNIVPKGMTGERFHKKFYVYGDREDVKPFKKEHHYSDIALRKSIKTAIRRGHDKIHVEDLRSFERRSKGECYIIYALDASGSMKGKKVSTCKRAGIALAFNAIREKDNVGLIVFGTEVREIVLPTKDFTKLLTSITKVQAEAETDIAATIRKAVEMFPSENVTKHLLLLTDALPTRGDKPEEAALEAASLARSAGITISIIGINLDEKGKTLAEKLVAIGSGRLYAVKDLEEIGKIVLLDYYSVY